MALALTAALGVVGEDRGQPFDRTFVAGGYGPQPTQVLVDVTFVPSPIQPSGS